MTDDPDARYLIRKRGAFYRPNAEGYTNNRAEAGRYTLAQAIWHSHPNGPDGPRDGVDYIPANDTPQPAFADWVKRYCGQQDPARMRFSLGELAVAFKAGRETPPDALPCKSGEGAGEIDGLTRRVAEVVNEDGGCWTACSGCQESDEGYVSEKYYPYSSIFRCQPGGGCSECGGIGVLWQDGAFLASYGDTLSEDATQTREAESMSHRCETCGTKDGHAEGCAENVPPEDEATDPGFLIDLASRLFVKATPAMGFDQGDTDRLIAIAMKLANADADAGKRLADQRALDFQFVETFGTDWLEGSTTGKTVLLAYLLRRQGGEA